MDSFSREKEQNHIFRYDLVSMREWANNGYEQSVNTAKIEK